MTDNPISEYQTKLKELRTITRSIEKMVATVVSGADNLNHWRQVVVTSAGKVPPELIGSPRIIDANDWPTGQQIGQLLSQWHDIKVKTDQAYKRIPPSQREGVQTPPD